MTKQAYLILGAVFVLVLAGAVLVREKKKIEPIPQPPVVTPTPESPVPQQEPKQDYTTRTHPRAERKIIEGWNIYTNNEFGFEVQYPKGWFLYDLEKFNKDNKDSACYPSGPSEIANRVIFSKADLGKCVVLGPSAHIHIGDLEISVFPTEYKEMVDGEVSEYKGKVILLDGVRAVKFLTTYIDGSSQGKFLSVSANYNGKYYNIFFKQTDVISDQILSTFRFLK